jgi:hypothetical protein
MKKIKLEYIDKTIVQKDGILGNRKIVVATIDPTKYSYYYSIGLGYLFEEDKPIKYVGIEQEVIEEPVEEVKPKKTRKRNATTEE